jgi:hypothetical protein
MSLFWTVLWTWGKSLRFPHQVKQITLQNYRQFDFLKKAFLEMQLKFFLEMKFLSSFT